MRVENVYEAVTQLPYGKPWVPSHMILIRQRFADGKIKKYKARLVAGGHRQDATLYDDVSSPTARPASIKILFAKAAIENKIVRTFDVKGAYLKSNIDQEIYMLLPNTTKNKEKNWVKLHKSIYGLKQAGLLWFQNIKGKLLKFGAQQCRFDECVFKYIEGNEVIYIIIYVDDILSASSTNAITEKLLKYLREQYGEVNEVTNTATHLGIRWIRLRDGSIKINQPGYIDKILKEMNMENCDTVQAPIMSAFTREKNRMTTQIEQATGGDTLEEKQHELRKIIGLLNHIAIHTRPDILFAVSRLSTNIMNANDEYINDGKYIIKYLKGTKDLGLTFSTKVKPILVGYVDASYLTHEDAKSHSGICYSLGQGSTACFFSKSAKQKLVTRSSAEAELYALDISVCDVQWFRKVLQFLDNTQTEPTTIYEDNMSAMTLATHETKPKDCSKHINMRYHYCKDAIKNKEIYLEYINTKDQIADILTKNITSISEFKRLRALLMNIQNTDPKLK